LLLGVDLGGTKIEAALVDVRREGEGGPRLEVLSRRRIPTHADQGYEAIVHRVVELARALAHEQGLPELPPLGIGLPGGFSSRTGVVKNANTQCLNGRDFREDVLAALGPAGQRDRVFFENDANCLVLAETLLGAARSYRDGVVFGVILGTGIGGGWMAHGRLITGRHGIAGEWGHHTLQPGGNACYCGRSGCVETYLSGPALGRRFSEACGATRTAAEGVALASANDAPARVAFAAYLDDFGRALGNVIDILDPDAIVLGGGLSNIDALFEAGRERVAANVFNEELTTPFLRAELGDSAGVFGAALLGLAGVRQDTAELSSRGVRR
jgi:fructokinase